MTHTNSGGRTESKTSLEKLREFTRKVVSVPKTGRGISVDYTTTTGANNGAWAGAGFSYDTDPNTTALEYHDLSGLGTLVFGLKCTEPTVKLELVDTNNKTSGIYLTGVSSTQETFYSVDLSKLIGSADLSKISFIYVIVEGENKAGTLEINKLKVSDAISPDATKGAADINIPTEGFAVPAGVTVNPSGATADLTKTGRGISVDYTTTTGANNGA